jgi:uncharacterized phiE125 gp8 family phage protein
MTGASSFKRTSNPGMPYTLAEGRIQLKNEEVSYDDALITALIKASGEMAENKTNRAFMQSTWQWTGIDFPPSDCNGFFKLEPGPLVSVTSIKYYPVDSEVLTTLDPSEYQVDTSSVPGRVRFLNSLPDVDDRYDAVQIVFVAGYGAVDSTEAAQQAALPPSVVAWMKLQLGQLYKFRELHVQGQPLYSITTFSDGLIYPYIL